MIFLRKKKSSQELESFHLTPVDENEIYADKKLDIELGGNFPCIPHSLFPNRLVIAMKKIRLSNKVYYVNIFMASDFDVASLFLLLRTLWKKEK